MRDAGGGYFILFLVAVFLLFAVRVGTEANAQSRVMREAFDRGYAQQCIGTARIHWRGECPEARQ